MTSSLVGSEMCIRDRQTAQQWLGLPPQGVDTGLHAQHAPASPPPSLAPVSYTHLTLPTICSV
eukprot:9985924-Prorocentrum_lima.AAC.1